MKRDDAEETARLMEASVTGAGLQIMALMEYLDHVADDHHELPLSVRVSAAGAVSHLSKFLAYAELDGYPCGT